MQTQLEKVKSGINTTKSNVSNLFSSLMNKTKPKEVTDYSELDELKGELEIIVSQLKVREANFNNAIDKDYIDIATFELNVTRQKYSVVLKRIKDLTPAKVESDDLTSLKNELKIAVDNVQLKKENLERVGILDISADIETAKNELKEAITKQTEIFSKITNLKK